MRALQVLGMGSMVLASLALGTRLVRLHLRTRQWPELVIGAAFLLAGVVGWGVFSVQIVLRAEGADPVLLHRLTLAGLGFSAAGALSNALGVALVFRPGKRWPVPLIGLFAAAMGAGWLHVLVTPPEIESPGLWGTLLVAAGTYTWTGIESIVLHDALARRARLGLADPVIASRARLWAVANAAVVTLIGIGFANRLASGPHVVPEWVSTVQSLCGLVCAGAVWIGFFPPLWYRRRIAAGAEG